MQSPTNNFSIESPADKTTSGHVSSTPDRKPSFKSLTSEKGFHEKSPENQAYVKLLDEIRPKDRTDTTEIVDLVSPAESPAKSTDIDVLSVTNIQNVEERRDEGRRDDLVEHQDKQKKENQITVTKE